MSAIPPDFALLGPGIRNICDKLINELNSSIIKISENKGESVGKIKDLKILIKNNFYSYIKRMPRIIKYLNVYYLKIILNHYLMINLLNLKKILSIM